MQKNYLLQNKTAQSLYESVKDMPIIDYHCHLSPKEIYEDLPFDNIGKMWLECDHYKWRLMRASGIDEEYITGSASWHDKFIKYAEAIEMSAGNPLYHWSHMELSMYFGIDDYLTADSAEDIWQRANAYIKEKALSPRKLIKQSGVEVICTTDDIIDSLEWHKKLKDSFSVKVIPSYRTDNLLLMLRDGYLDYLDKLSAVSGVKITSLADLKAAAKQRLEYFVDCGCKFSDIGMPYFPNAVYSDERADKVFAKILDGEKVNEDDYLGLVGNMYLYLGGLYKEYGLVMQLHLSVMRNVNSVLFNTCGADCGVDTVGDCVDGPSLAKMLDAINKTTGLPKTIIYTLNPANASQIASIAHAFRGVVCGAAWWFCDHKRGIREQLEVISENASLGQFYGMLTDSRSFLSYARHDYFRRILCTLIGEWVELYEYNPESATKIVQKICYQNIKKVIGEGL